MYSHTTLPERQLNKRDKTHKGPTCSSSYIITCVNMSSSVKKGPAGQRYSDHFFQLGLSYVIVAKANVTEPIFFPDAVSLPNLNVVP